MVGKIKHINFRKAKLQYLLFFGISILFIGIYTVGFSGLFSHQSARAAGTVASVRSGLWSATSTWDGGVVPIVGDDVTIAVGHIVTSTSNIAQINNLTIGGTLVQDNAVQQVIDGTLLIQSGGKLTHSPNSTTALGQRYIVNFSVGGDATINAGGSIDVDGKGYGSASNVNNWTASNGPGAGWKEGNYGSGSGGGHGGDGGYTSYVGGGSGYCDITNVATMGSAGGSNGGGAGGGLIILGVTGKLIVNGKITADGSVATVNSRGGGAGGGIKITAGTIDWDMTTPATNHVSVAGGNFGGGDRGGGGGGGCAQITYTDYFSHDVVASDVLLSGGTGSVYVNPGYQYGQRGGSGLLLIKKGSADADLYLKNDSSGASSVLNGNVTANTATFNYAGLTLNANLVANSIVLNNSPVLSISAGKTLTLNNSSPYSGDGTGTINVSGSFTLPVSGDPLTNTISGLTVALYTGGTLTNAGNISVASTGALKLLGGTVANSITTLTSSGVLWFDRASTFTLNDLIINGNTTTLYNFTTSTSPLALANLTINSGGKLNHEANSTTALGQKHIVSISASGDITINAGGSIDVDGKGYSSITGCSTGWAYCNGPGGGFSENDYGSGSGGGHGGYGGYTKTSRGEWGSSAYCDISNVATIGSAGGSAGGAGGGLIILGVAGKLTVNGKITADGSTSIVSTRGGGAGGGIKITAGTIDWNMTTPATNHVSVNGGNYGSGTRGGGGGGGCAQITYTDYFSHDIVASDVLLSGGSGAVATGGQRGGSGLLLIKKGSADADLYLKNDSSGASSILNGNLTANTATFNYAGLTINTGKTLILNSATPILGDGLTAFAIYGTLSTLSLNNLVSISLSGTLTAPILSSINNLLITLESGAILTNGVSNILTIGSAGGFSINSTTTTVPITGGALTSITSSGTLALDRLVTPIDPTALFSINSGTTTLYNYTLANPLTVSGFTIASGATLTHPAQTLNSVVESSIINIQSSGNITINGKIDTIGKGFNGYYTASSTMGRGIGPGAGYATKCGGQGTGAGHGGVGGHSITDSFVGPTYGDETIPTVGTMVGSSGPGYNCGTIGGYGGGAVILNSSNGTLDLNGGRIYVDGETNTAAYLAGGGSGGTVYLKANIITGTPVGITAKGGNAYNTSVGGGGGGRIRVESIGSNSLSAVASYFSVLGGSGHESGAPGPTPSIALLTPASPTTLYSHSTNAVSGDINPVNITSLNPFFSSPCDTPDSTNCTSYLLEVDNDSNFSSPIWSSSTTSLTVADGARSSNITYAGPSLSYNTTYYWRIRFISAIGTGPWSTETATFYAPRSLELYNFNFGGAVQVGQNVDILWGSTGGPDNEAVKIEYATDGVTWHSVSSSVASASSTTGIKSSSWTVPNDLSTTAKIKITSLSDPNFYEISENSFTIQAGSSANGVKFGRNFKNSLFYTADSSVTFGDSVDWYNLSWAKRKTITFTSDVAKIPASQTNFPVLINITSDADLAANAQITGDDILFTDSIGTKLNHEIESYTNATGALVAWVKVPTLSVDGTIVMYYGNASAASQQNKTGVWDSNFKMVQHLNGATTAELDSTSNSNNATAAAQVTLGVSGQIGKANTLSGNGAVTIPNSVTDYPATVSYWIKPTNRDTNQIQFYLYMASGKRLVLGDYNGTYLTSVTGKGVSPTYWNSGIWSHVTMIQNSASDVKIYVNGIDRTGTSGDNWNETGAASSIGGRAGSYLFTGGVDEFRVSNIARSANWITSEYANQNSPSTFYSVGSETLPAIPSLDAFFRGSDANYSTDQKVSFITGHTFSTVNSFSSNTAGTGAVGFQISDNNGTTWKYCEGNTLTIANDTFAKTNSVDQINNTCLSQLTAGTFNVRAFFHLTASGQYAALSDLSFNIVNNTAPALSNLAVTNLQNGTGQVKVAVTTNDADGNNLKIKTEYKLGNCDIYSEVATTTLVNSVSSTYFNGDIVIDNTASDGFNLTTIKTSSGANEVWYYWDVVSQVPTANGTYCLFLTPNDGTTDGTRVSTTVIVDNVVPMAPGDLTLNTSSTTSATLNFGTTSADDNFSQYKIHYREGANGVLSSDPAITLSTDTNLGSINYNNALTTIIPNLTTSTQYVANIWAYDSYGNSTPATIPLSFYTLAGTPDTPMVVVSSTSILHLTITPNNNPANVTYSICRTVDDYSCDVGNSYLQADGSLGASAVWQDYSTWGGSNGVDIINLSENAGFKFIVQARNPNNIVTNFSLPYTTAYTLSGPLSSFSAINTSNTTTLQIDLSFTTTTQSGLKITRNTGCSSELFDTTIYDDTNSLPSSPSTTINYSPNTCYRFRAFSYNLDGTINLTNYITSSDITTPPAQVLGLTADNIEEGEIDWIWTAVPGATSYSIYLYNSNTELIGTASSDTNSYIQSGLTRNTTYIIEVRAQNSNGLGITSGQAEAVTDATVPTGLTTSARTVSSVTWVWDADTIAENQTEFYARDASAVSGWITLNNWQRVGLGANAVSVGKVKARNSVSQETAYSPTVTSYSSQNAPTGISFSGVTNEAIVATALGTFPNNGVGSAALYFTNHAGPASGAVVAGTSWSNSSLNPNTQYTYTVLAKNSGDESTASATASKYTLANTPGKITVAVVDNDSTKLSLTLSSNSNPVETNYLLVCTTTQQYVDNVTKTLTGDISDFDTLTNWTNTVTLTGLTPNTLYQFESIAKNGEQIHTANSPISDAIYTPASLPASVVVTPLNPTEITVSWDANGNPSNTKYWVEDANNDQRKSDWITDTSYTFSGLTPGTEYVFQVKAKNNDEVNNIQTAFVIASASASNPNTPGIITVTRGSNATSLNLVLGPNGNSHVSTYARIFSTTTNQYVKATDKTLTGDSTDFATFNNWGDIFTVTGLTPNTKYQFDSIAKNILNVLSSTSTDSIEIYTKSAIPTDISAKENDSTSITVSWTANGNPDGTQYFVQETSKNVLNSNWITANSYTFSGLTASTQYSFKVQSRNVSEVSSDFSSVVSAATLSAGGSATIIAPPFVPEVNIPAEVFSDDLLNNGQTFGENTTLLANTDSVSLVGDNSFVELQPNGINESSSPEKISLEVQNQLSIQGIPIIGTAGAVVIFPLLSGAGFNIDGEAHTVSYTTLSSDGETATVVVRSTPQKVKMKNTEERVVDVNNDGHPDLYLKVKDINQKTRKIQMAMVDTSRLPFTINYNLGYTSSTKVNLYIKDIPNVEQIAISEDPSFKGISFQPYTKYLSFNLSPNEGLKTIYLRLRSVQGATADVKDAIVYTKDIAAYKILEESLEKETTTNTTVNTVKTEIVKAFNTYLTLGSKGTEVTRLQIFLKDLNYFIYPQITNFFGNITKNALKLFQKDNNLNTSGALDINTRKTINNIILSPTNVTNTTSTTPITTKVTLTKNICTGSIGQEVRNLQTILMDLGYLKIPKTTGTYASKTKSAVRQYQVDHSISPANGCVGPLTRGEMNGMIK